MHELITVLMLVVGIVLAGWTLCAIYIGIKAIRAALRSPEPSEAKPGPRPSRMPHNPFEPACYSAAREY